MTSLQYVLKEERAPKQLLPGIYRQMSKQKYKCNVVNFVHLIMNKLVESSTKLQGYILSIGKTVKNLCFTYDAKLIGDSEDNLQRLLYKF